MKYFSEDKDFVNAECEVCKKILKIRKTSCQFSADKFELNQPLKCFCGNISNEIIFVGKRQESTNYVSNKTSSAVGMVCPHCQSRGSVTTKIVKRKKGVSGAKATGALLTLGWSLLVTGLSRKEEETEAHCTACGATWHFS